MSCPPPPSVTHGSFSPSKENYELGEVVEYSCYKDYEMEGQKTLSCSETGAFKPAPPMCTRKSFFSLLNHPCNLPNAASAVTKSHDVRFSLCFCCFYLERSQKYKFSPDAELWTALMYNIKHLKISLVYMDERVSSCSQIRFKSFLMRLGCSAIKPIFLVYSIREAGACASHYEISTANIRALHI